MITAGERPGVTQSVAFEEVQEGAKCKVHLTPLQSVHGIELHPRSKSHVCLSLHPSSGLPGKFYICVFY